MDAEHNLHSLLSDNNLDVELKAIAEKVSKNERINFAEGVVLY